MEQVLLAEAEPVFVPLRRSDWGLDPEAVAAAVTPRTKAIIINSPHNPTGAVFAKEDLLAVAAIAERHGLYVICDDTYDALTYDGPAFSLTSVAALRDRLVAVGSFSKRYALTGWRVGFAFAPEPIMNEFPSDPDVFDRQARRLQDAVENLFACCQARIALQSERFGLPPAALRALLALGESRYLAPGELGRRLGVTKSRVTAVTTGLSRHKLIEKHPDPADARVTLLTLTPAGRRARDQVRSFMKGLFQGMMGRKRTTQPSNTASNGDLPSRSASMAKSMTMAGAAGFFPSHPHKPTSKGAAKAAHRATGPRRRISEQNTAAGMGKKREKAGCGPATAPGSVSHPFLPLPETTGLAGQWAVMGGGPPRKTAPLAPYLLWHDGGAEHLQELADPFGMGRPGRARDQIAADMSTG